MEYVAPNTVVWLRFTVGVIILGLAVALYKQFSLPTGRDWGYVAILGFLGITFHQGLQSTRLLTAQTTTRAWIVTSTPIFIALLGFFILKERLAWYQIAGIIWATFGVLLIVSKGSLSTLANGRLSTLGDFLVLISTVNWAVFSTISHSGLKKHPATLMMFYVMGFGWLFTSILFFVGPGVREIALIT